MSCNWCVSLDIALILAMRFYHVFVSLHKVYIFQASLQKVQEVREVTRIERIGTVISHSVI